jgi:pyrroloquinoline quinone biosynthesis protein B
MRLLVGLLSFLVLSCATATTHTPYVEVLGIAQDGGYPQAGCEREDCIAAWNDERLRRRVASLAIVDPISGERWIIDATPDFPEQLHAIGGSVDGIFLTHAHAGHYTGLMHLGREVMGSRAMPVYAMPRMRAFLERNGPWDQLVRLKNIELRSLADGQRVQLNERIAITPLAVPHRDEYSETVGFVVEGPSGSVLWLPDIDKWEKWPAPVESVVERVDVAYVDGTFHDERELPGRDLSEIPHPTIRESMDRFAKSGQEHKVRFMHLNQSNPALRDRDTLRAIRRRGFAVAREGERVPL